MGNMMEEFTPQAIRSAGLPSYWGAEFDFRTAPSVIESVKRAADNGLFGFTILTPAYLDRVAWWFETQRGCPIKREWILPTHGTIFSVATAIRAFSAEGEGVIAFSPGYMRYRQATERLGRRTVESGLILRDGRYQIDFADLETKMAEPSNRLLVLCNPNNPTGNVWARADLEKIADLARRHGVLVFSDEIFAEIAFEGARVVPYHDVAGESAASITCTSLGKCFGLTGVNHANVVIPDPVTRERFWRQRNADHYGSVDPFLHAALMGAYSEAGASWLSAMRDYVWGNYLFVDSFLRRELPGVTVTRPGGTYVLWMDFRGLGLAGEELSKFLVEEAFLCLDKGEGYGGDPGYMRMNISVPRHEIERSFGLLLAAARARGLAK
jgi:cystathionine beta-lyase